MTIEERIEVLFRFHEAHEANLNRLFEMQAKNETMLAGVIEGMADLKYAVAGMQQSILGLARIAEAHEHRISNLERPQ